MPVPAGVGSTCSPANVTLRRPGRVVRSTPPAGRLRCRTMLVYTSTKREFIRHVAEDEVADRILSALRKGGRSGVSPQEVASWRNSLQYMRNVLDDRHIPDDVGVSLEFRIPQSSKRIDVILTGLGRAPLERPAAVIVELKQWTTASCTPMDGIVSTFLGGATREVPHPSYQAWSYAALLQDYNETVQLENVDLRPCAFLHNCTSTELRSVPYAEHIQRAPLFLKAEQDKLRRFIRQHVRKGDRGELMYRIDSGRIRPSKSLSDHLTGLLKGRSEFHLIDDQKVVYETALRLAGSEGSGKQVYIVEGGPGTGKSVVAINLLVELTAREQVAQYVSRNAAPRQVYAAKLAGTLKRTRIDNLFKGSGAYVETPPDTFGTLIVDEAHRLNERSGLYANLGENQIAEIVRSARTSVFFIDESQRVTLKDIGSVEAITRVAGREGACVTFGRLESQFRCNGSDGYLAWVDHVLQVRTTANTDLTGIDYDFRVFSSPTELHDRIRSANVAANKARVVAGYCWDWRSKNDPAAFDIVFPQYDYAAQWNLREDGSLWILGEDSVEQVGCIHTCQGLELDYVGVIVGPDLLVRDGCVVTDGLARSKNDSTVRGYKGMHRRDPEAAQRLAAEIIKNTYRTLMTRGTKGCWLWSPDDETREYFSSWGATIG